MKEKISSLMILLAIGFNANCLQACKTCSPTIVTKIEQVPPPSYLLIPCVKPKTNQIKTNQDLAFFASSAILAWESCAAQIDALRLYYGIDSDSEKE